ncbi:ArsR/SmtB family transcription factor [Psychromicrobium sp. YIM B11713]|uniref:ArsR/SmtB family transcription factor n=1 Tax=Psychromicrobium sp. YIM B11713 TaxID=3145233 RepID=UPI00374FDA04
MSVELVRRCAALGDQTRWEILRLLGSQTLSASALAQRLPVSRQAIVKHLKILHEVGLVSGKKYGREVVYSALGSELSFLATILEQHARNWDKRLTRVRRIDKTP